MILSLVSILATVPAAPTTIEIDAGRPTVKVSPSLYGIFFEEINFAGDGGIHSELIRNRGFEEGVNGSTPAFWEGKNASVKLDPTVPFNDGKTRSLRVAATGSNAEVSNTGFWGVPIRRGERYRLVIWARSDKPSSLAIGGTRSDGKPSTDVSIVPTGSSWKRSEVTLTGSDTDFKSKLTMRLKNTGAVSIGYVSLKPLKGWGKDNLIRTDLGEKIAAMKPAFVRFPGGCYVEGNDLAQAFDWKASLGQPEARPGHPRRLWGYSSTDGLGYHEYLQWCEDLGAEPLYVANCGMSHTEIAPMDKMQKYVDDALDAIEYANGSVDSKWGALRAANGHPKPFGLKYVEIGNENGLSWSFGGRPPYAERYDLIYRAIKAKYPEILTIANDPVPHPMEIVDEHYYNNPSFFWQQMNRYDRYDRKGPRIYVGEYAVTSECGKGNLQAGLAEAAFMTGMERNSDVVTMSSYAPLLVNDNARQWNPDAIVFNNYQSYGTPSYWVQQLFATNRPDRIVPVRAEVPAEVPRPQGGIGLMTWETAAEFRDIKLVADGKTLYDSNAAFGPWKSVSGKWAIDNGVITQTGLETDRRTYLPNIKVDGAKRTTLTVRARKLSGREGFIIITNARSEADRVQLNLGGWGNTEHGFESGGRIGRAVKGKIETNRWYNIRIEVDGDRVSGYLDDQLIDSVVLKPTPKLASTAGLSADGKTLILKVVNGSEQPLTAKLKIAGFNAGSANVTTLTGPNMLAENSFATPMLMAPKSSRWAGDTYQFQPRSLTILRMSRR